MPLTIAVKLWPTPTANDARNAGYQKGRGEKVYLTLPGAAGAAPVPPGKIVSGNSGPSWPTPNARDYKGAPGAGARERGGHQSSLPASVKNSDGSGSLNPTWVEWLMGFPLGWLDLEPSEMPSSHKSQKSSAA